MLSIQQLHKSFGDLEVLNGIDLEVDQGKVVVVVGPSGSGKTTLLRCLNILETPTKGSVSIEDQTLDFDGKVPKKDIRELRRKTGMVFQTYNLFPHKTALENVIEGPVTVQKVDKAEAINKGTHLLEKVGLGDKIDYYPFQLSGGQQQRVGIARALAMDPEVMLFDEPTSALDPISSGKIEDLIHELKKEFTIVIVTHNMQQAARVSDNTAFLYMGNLVEYGDTQKIFTNPEKDRTQNYITGRFG